MSPVDSLIADFPDWLEYFADMTPLDSGYRQYLDTVNRRKQLGSTAAAISSDEFIENLHRTLSGFFRLSRRRAKLLPVDDLRLELRKYAPQIGSFDGHKLGGEPSGTVGALWNLINQMKLTTEKPRLVSGTKTLHLLLPDLVVPVDRRYTGAFLYRHSDDFEAGVAEKETFRVAFAAFRKIANAVNPEIYVGTHEVHATPTKVIDNGIIAFVGRVRAELSDELKKQTP